MRGGQLISKQDDKSLINKESNKRTLLETAITYTAGIGLSALIGLNIGGAYACAAADEIGNFFSYSHAGAEIGGLLGLTAMIYFDRKKKNS